MEPVDTAAERFGFYNPLRETITDGLIHKTYKVTVNNRSAVLQQVNILIFKDINTVINNYTLVYNHLKQSSEQIIPALLKTTDGKNTWLDADGSCWRAFEFIDNTCTESLPASPDKVFSAAKCFGGFIAALNDLDSRKLKPAIPDFHDLSNRYFQLQQAITQAQPQRLTASKELLEKIGKRKNLLEFYRALKNSSRFRLRAMHHDAKLSNILFSKTSGQAVCPIDLDTVMPGYFFSDVGDMVRSMISASDEDAPAGSVHVEAEIYSAIMAGYKAGIGNIFTEEEWASIHYSGKIMLYMQCIRFLSDYLNNDVYYKIDYPDQNFNRAFNQMTLLEKLEEFLQQEYDET